MSYYPEEPPDEKLWGLAIALTWLLLFIYLAFSLKGGS